jgi:hypothetical protein
MGYPPSIYIFEEVYVRIRSMPVIFAVTALLAVSCASAPPAATISSTAPEAEMAKAKEQRAYIKDNGLDAYAPDSFGKAEEAFLSAEKVYGKDDGQAREQLALALPLYEQTVKDGFAKKIAEKKASADTAKSKADGVKAKVAAKETYAAAEAAYAKAAAVDTPPADAAAAYEEASKKFEEAAVQAADAKTRAQAAIESADAEIQSTSKLIKAIDEEMGSTEGGTP